MRSVIAWLRLVSPPLWTWGCSLASYAAMEWIYRLTQSQGGQPQELDVTRGSRDAVLIGSMSLYAIFRVHAFHPLFRADYSKWLRLTPWRRSLPLPLGPVHLVPQDLLTVGLATSLCYDSPFVVRCAVPFGFLSAYLGYLAVSFWLTKLPAWAYAIGFSLGGAVWLAAWNPLAGLAFAALLCPVASAGLRRSLDRFPWQDLPQELSQQLQAQKSPTPRSLGWPWDALSPKRETELPFVHKAMICLLCGWWQTVLLAISPMWEEEALLMAVGLSGLALASSALIDRLHRYFSYHAPPISFWGRLVTLRWVIPSYDVALVAFLVAFSVPGAGVFALRLGADPRWVIPLCTVVAMLTLWAGGPNAERWRLTSAARLSPDGFHFSSQHYEEI